MSTRERFLRPYKECFAPLSNQCGISQSTLFGDPTSLLAHRPVTDFNTICNRSSPLLANIFRFGPLRIVVSTREKFPHPYNECFTFLSNQYGISQSTLLTDPTSSLAHRPVTNSDTICNSSSLLLTNIVHFDLLRIEFRV